MDRAASECDRTDQRAMSNRLAYPDFILLLEVSSLRRATSSARRRREPLPGAIMAIPQKSATSENRRRRNSLTSSLISGSSSAAFMQRSHASRRSTPMGVTAAHAEAQVAVRGRIVARAAEPPLDEE